jgi:hypothetical protein
MAIEFHCNQCGRLLRTGDDTAGRMAQCPECGSQTPIPFPADEPATPAEVEIIEPNASEGTTFGDGSRESQSGEHPFHPTSPYGPPSHGHDPFRKQAVTSLVLGSASVILSTFCCVCFPLGLIVSLVGLAFGVIGLRSTTQRNLAVIGLALSGVGLAIALLAGAFFQMHPAFQGPNRPLR